MAFPRARTLPELFDVIAPIAEQFQTALIQIIDPKASGTWIPYDPDTDEGGYWGESVLYEGQARVQQLSPADNRSAQLYNPSTEMGFRIQVPLSVFGGKVERGWQVKVVSAKDQSLAQYPMFIRAGVNSSVAAVRDIIAVSDIEAEPGTNPDGPVAD